MTQTLTKEEYNIDENTSLETKLATPDDAEIRYIVDKE